MEINQKIAIRINEIMHSQGLNAKTLHQLTFLSKRDLNKILKAKIKDVKTEHVFIICSALGITPFEFFNSSLFDKDT